MPVFKKVTALVMVPVAPLSWRLLTVLASVKVVTLTSPLKLAVPPMFCKVKVVTPATLVPETFAPATALPVAKVKA